MREIRFRVWKDYSAQFEYFTLEEMMASKEDDLSRIQQSSPSNIEQYTGLKGKNGKEIYEGDILNVKTSSYGEYIVPVAYDSESAFFATDNHQAKQISNPGNWALEHDKVESYGFLMDRYSQLIGGYNNTYNHKSKSYDIEIIGNIHENKDLLK